MLGPLLAMVLLTGATEDTPATLSNLIDRFLGADTIEGSQKEAERILALAPSFDSVYEQIGAGRRYSADVKRGIIERSRRNRDGTRHRYLLAVPEDYDPGRRYPVHVYLHGGVHRRAWDRGGGWCPEPKRLLSDNRIAIVPASWSDSKWWQASQVENVGAILREVKRLYNVDENRVSLFGISDGGSGAWFFAFRNRTPWASFLPFIGSPAVLSNPTIGAEGAFFFDNLYGGAFLVINGSEDPLYPADVQRPLVEFMKKVGADVTFEVVEGGGHNVRWSPERAAMVEGFVESHVRDPFPDQFFWISERTDRFNRAYWVVLDELAPGGTHGQAQLAALGPTPDQVGAIGIRRHGNTVNVLARGIARYLLLLSPEEFDLDAEILVRTNGRESFRGLVPRCLATLLGWAARDMDRTMLFAAELAIQVPSVSQ